MSVTTCGTSQASAESPGGFQVVTLRQYRAGRVQSLRGSIHVPWLPSPCAPSDTFCPAGPALVTVDEFAWDKPLTMSTKVNGEIRQESDTSDLYFGIDELVSYASRSMTLYPGDIIATGSPAGVAFFMKPPRFLQAGDIVRCEIEGVGVIENAVRAESFS